MVPQNRNVGTLLPGTAVLSLRNIHYEHFSLDTLIRTVKEQRAALGLTQKELSERTGINRTMVGHMENGEYTPFIKQLEALSEALEFDMTEVFAEEVAEHVKADRPYRIAVAGTEPLERDYGFKPNTSLRDGLRKFAEWYKEFYL